MACFPLQGRGRRFEPVNAHGKAAPLLGFPCHRHSDGKVRDARRTRSDRRAAQRQRVSTPVEVPTNIDHGVDRTVSETFGDHFRVLPLSDQQWDLGMPHECVPMPASRPACFNAGFQNRRVQLVPRIDPRSGAGNIGSVGVFETIARLGLWAIPADEQREPVVGDGSSTAGDGHA